MHMLPNLPAARQVLIHFRFPIFSCRLVEQHATGLAVPARGQQRQAARERLGMLAPGVAAVHLALLGNPGGAVLAKLALVAARKFEFAV